MIANAGLTSKFPLSAPADEFIGESAIAQFQGRSAQKRGTIVTACLTVWDPD